MGKINLLDIKPNKVVKNLSGYMTMIYGEPGVGKTTLASQIDRALIIDTEQGANAIAGVMKVDVFTWNDVLQVVAQLRQPDVQKMFDVIVIDTVDELVFMATQHVLQINGIKALGDLGYGKGYTLLEDELRKVFNNITRYYGLLVIGHEQSRMDEETDEKFASLAVPNTARKILNRMMDVVAYVESSRSGDAVMHYRATPDWEAKSRFRYIAETSEFSYEAFTSTIIDAINKEIDSKGGEGRIVEKEQTTNEMDFSGEIPEFFNDVEKLKTATNDAARELVTEKGQGMFSEVQLLVGQFLPGSSVTDATEEQLEGIQNVYKGIMSLLAE